MPNATVIDGLRLESRAGIVVTRRGGVAVTGTEVGGVGERKATVPVPGARDGV